MNVILRNINRKTAAYVASAAFVGLVIGFLSGRECMKYEFRSALQSAVADVASTFSGRAKQQDQLPQTSTGNTSSPLEVALLKKQFQAHDYQSGEVEDVILMSLSIRNVTNKDMRAIDGVLVVTDLLDNRIMSIKLALNDPLASGSMYNWNGRINYNPYMEDNQRLRGATPENLKLSFLPHKALFSDGSVKEYR